jgi:hypothetical protein
MVLCLSLQALGQTGGEHSYEFLNVPGSARLAALGGVNSSLTDRDINFFFSNPALVSDSLAGFGSASYQFYVADIGQATFAYAHDFTRIGTVAMGIQHMSYGESKSYDAAGQEIGTFKSGETNVVISKSHQISHYRFGANLKGAFSNMGGYRSSAILLDLGGVFIHPQKDFRVGMVIRNLGFVVSEYSATSNTKVPIDVQIGTTFKPEHMPLRFSFTAYNLVNDLDYMNPSTGDEPGTLDKVLRHFNFGAEVLIHRNVNVLVGYNYLTHQELKLENGGGGAGLSLGFSARIKAVEFCFSRAGYVMGQAGYTFTVAWNMQGSIL